MVLTWFRLKALYKHNSIHNIKSRKIELAKYCGMSDSKFRQHYKELIRLKLITEKNNIAFIASKSKLSELAGLPTQIKTKHLNVGINDLEFDKFQAILHEQFYKQRYYIAFNKFLDYQKELKLGKINDAKLKKKIKFTPKQIAEFKKDFDKQQENCQAFNPKNRLFFDAQISQNKLGYLFGGLHRTTISKRLKKYAKKRLLRVKERFIEVGNIVSDAYNWFVRSQFGAACFQVEGVVYRRIPNLITFTTDNTIQNTRKGCKEKQQASILVK